MKGIIWITLFLGVLGAQAQQVDSERSGVSFSLSNLGFKTVKGTVSGMTGTVEFDENALDQSKMDVTLEVNRLSTQSEKRDEHLMKEDFFEANVFPLIRFQSSKVEKVDGKYQVLGHLTVKKTMKEVSIPFTVEKQDDALLFSGHILVHRKDFGIGESYGNFMVGEEVEVEIKCWVSTGK